MSLNASSSSLPPSSQRRPPADPGALSLVHGGEVPGSDVGSHRGRADGVQPRLQGRAVRRGTGAGQPQRRRKTERAQTRELINGNDTKKKKSVLL